MEKDTRTLFAVNSHAVWCFRALVHRLMAMEEESSGTKLPSACMTQAWRLTELFKKHLRRLGSYMNRYVSQQIWIILWP